MSKRVALCEFKVRIMPPKGVELSNKVMDAALDTALRAMGHPLLQTLIRQLTPLLHSMGFTLEVENIADDT